MKFVAKPETSEIFKAALAAAKGKVGGSMGFMNCYQLVCCMVRLAAAGPNNRIAAGRCACGFSCASLPACLRTILVACASTAADSTK